MVVHSPEKCFVCGKYHCLAGCVPVQECIAKTRQLPAHRIERQIEKLEEFRSDPNYDVWKARAELEDLVGEQLAEERRKENEKG